MRLSVPSSLRHIYINYVLFPRLSDYYVNNRSVASDVSASARPRASSSDRGARIEPKFPLSFSPHAPRLLSRLAFSTRQLPRSFRPTTFRFFSKNTRAHIHAHARTHINRRVVARRSPPRSLACFSVLIKRLNINRSRKLVCNSSLARRRQNFGPRSDVERPSGMAGQ